MPERDDEERCPRGAECPRCGESRIDFLEIDLDADEDGNEIICATCGQRYKIELIAVGEGFRATPVEPGEEGHGGPE